MFIMVLVPEGDENSVWNKVDPALQGINCTSGDVCESVAFTNPEFCGKGNPTMVRVPCGNYAPVSVREFSYTMRRAAVCFAKLKKAGIEIILAEIDTIPFNRYGKNARYLHSHYTATILEGLRGANSAFLIQERYDYSLKIRDATTKTLGQPSALSVWDCRSVLWSLRKTQGSPSLRIAS